MVKQRVQFLLVVACLFPAAISAQSPFDGTWKVDLNLEKSTQPPLEYVLENGEFSCKSCTPPYSVKADGQDHKLSVSPYFDSMAITIVDDHTLSRVDKKDGQQVGTSKTWVSEDGQVLQREASRINAPGEQPETVKYSWKRISPGPKGSHAVSGRWQDFRLESLSENAQTFTLKVDGDTLAMSSPIGDSYTAKMDGTQAPVKGDRGTDHVSVKKLGPNALEETAFLNGTVVSITKMTVSPDGKTLKMTTDWKVVPQKTESTFNKQ